MLDPSALTTYVLIAATVITSLMAFSNPAWLQEYVLDVQAVRRGEHVRLLTSGFLHADGAHLAVNMFSLFFFGALLERVAGPAVLLAVYFGAIVGGGLLALVLHRKEDYRALGASGGVCGVIFAAIFFAPGTAVFIFPIPVPIPSWLYAILFVAYSVYGAKVQRDNVGHDAHLGGALVGLGIATLFAPAIALHNPLLYGAIVLGGIGAMVYLGWGPGGKRTDAS
ncbi:MAG: rhomboid family intramembrane serine protease [Opitutales bacterium]